MVALFAVKALTKKEAIMNAPTGNRSSHHWRPMRRVNAFAFVALGLLVLTAMLFYGPIFFLIFER
jgi:hypothetical protein